MDLTPSSLNGFYTTFVAPNFWQAYETTDVWWNKIATEMPSKGKLSTYAWQARIRRLRQWIGPRQAQNVASYPYTVTNAKWEDTVEIPRETFEDDDENFGIYQPTIAELGWACAKWPDDMLLPVIEGASATLCFDGQNFFSAAHPISLYQTTSGTYSNLYTGMPLTLDNYAAVRTAMRKYVGEDGKRLNINPNLLMVPAALEHEARRILMGDSLAEPTAGGVTQVGASTNVYKGTAELFVNPELTSDTAWYLMDTKKPIRPFLFQPRIKPVIVPRMDPSDPKVFDLDVFTWGVRARGNAGLTLPFLCAKATP